MKTPIAIGIVGASGSGKTTIARALAARCPDSCLISQDNWYRNRPDDALNWNVDDPETVDLLQLARDLAALKAGNSIDAPRYIFSSHRRADKPIALHPAPVLIVEGLFLFCIPQLRQLFDIRLFVDAPLRLCQRRRIQRDVRERGRTEQQIRKSWVERVEPMYQKHIFPGRKWADLLVKSDEFTPDQCANQIAKKIFQ